MPLTSHERPPPFPLLEAYRASEERGAARRLLEGGPRVEFGGFAGASLPFFLAALREPADPPLLVIAATEEEADEIAEELQAFGVPSRLFPAWESLFLEGSTPEGETGRDRLGVLTELARARGAESGQSTAGAPESPGAIVLAVHAAIQPVPSPEELERARRRLAPGESFDPRAFAGELERFGFRRVPLVERRLEYSVRGDIFDFFPLDGEHPARVELFGNVVETLRAFHPATQKSIAGLEGKPREFLLLPPGAYFRECFEGKGESLIFDHLPSGSRALLWEPEAVRERAEKIFHNLLGDQLGDDPAGDRAPDRGFLARIESRPVIHARSGPAPSASGGKTLAFGTVERYRSEEIERTLGHLRERLGAGQRFTVFCESAGDADRFGEILRDHDIGETLSGPADSRKVEVRTGPVRRGFSIASLSACVLSSRELFHRQVLRRSRRRETPARAIQSFLELAPGDFVVHLVHGVGRFRGTETLEKDGVLQEFLAVEFRDSVVVYVPVSKIDLVQKYIGSGGRAPILDRVGGSSWRKKKEAVESALVDMAAQLIDLQALRRERPGIAYPADGEWQRQFEAGFPFEDTGDQVEATAAIKRDMESPRPMDRLLCGDVGYGKTELAMRAAFKAAGSGKQVAILVPTTVLAQQHYRTFRERMAEFPLRVEVLSRFRSPREQREIARAASEGGIDILIGTHRLLSGDVNLSRLGLVIIDEEQRFGVKDKEKLKLLRATVDVLTLTATPIPRTLHMSLLGIRDISNLTTPPEGRMAVTTEVIENERPLMRDIILRELNRDGQVYFVHNRVQDIARVEHELRYLVPEARIAHGHGQMSEDELEEIMMRFLEREVDVLVSTTIIESGIDLPNVNTIFIDEADRYGLADLHQLRGRVGRGKHQAYCYLILPEHRALNPEAKKRVQTLKEFAELGAGFQIAMRDLEIRGAGNILGPEQSGHIALVGYEMYCRLLEKAAKRLRNEEYREPVAVEVNFTLEALIPAEYLEGDDARLEMYRRISLAREPEAVRELARELEDRFGEPPAPARRLLEVQELRTLALARGITALGREGERLHVQVGLEGSEGMRPLLEGAGERVQILDPRTVLVSLEKSPRSAAARARAAPRSDEDLFRASLEWLRTGKLPEAKPVFKIPTAPRAKSRNPQ